MKDLFSWMLDPSDDYYLELNQNATIIFDTNCLIDIYRMSYSKANEYLKILKFLREKDRIWIPYQVGYEFISNSQSYIEGTSEKFKNENISKKFEEIKYENLRKIIIKEPESNHKKSGEEFKLKLDEFKDNYEKLYNNLLIIIEELEAEYNQIFNYDKKFFFEEIISLFESRVGEDFSDDELEEFYKKGKDRYEKNIPPGFEDKDKDDYCSKYGDYLIWEQLLKYAEKESKSIIFVTNDKKKDWWIGDKNRKKPHPELRREFMSRIKKSFWMYDLSCFIEKTVKYLGFESTDELVEEIEEIEQIDESIKDMNAQSKMLKSLGLDPFGGDMNAQSKMLKSLDPFDVENRLKINKALQQLNFYEQSILNSPAIRVIRDLQNQFNK